MFSTFVPGYGFLFFTLIKVVTDIDIVRHRVQIFAEGDDYRKNIFLGSQTKLKGMLQKSRQKGPKYKYVMKIKRIRVLRKLNKYRKTELKYKKKKRKNRYKRKTKRRHPREELSFDTSCECGITKKQVYSKVRYNWEHFIYVSIKRTH